MSIYKGTRKIANNSAYDYAIARYVSNQELLDTKNEAAMLTGATSVATAKQMPYDGIIKISTPYNVGFYVYVLDPGKNQLSYHTFNGQGLASGTSGEVVFRKGDYLYFPYNLASMLGVENNVQLLFYKKRDYTGRS